MKAYELPSPSGLEALRLVELPMPRPGPGEVLVRIRAVTLNYRDLLVLRGGYGSRQKTPLIPLSDSAGVVEALGPGVQRHRPGDRVIGGFFPAWLDGEPTQAKLAGALGGSLDGVLARSASSPKRRS